MKQTPTPDGRRGSLPQALAALSLFQRIVVANTLIILLGAVGGTLLTRYLVHRVGDAPLILFFVAVGVTLSVAANTLLVSLALKPLYAVCERASAAVAGEECPLPTSIAGAGRDVEALSGALSTLVTRLERRNQELRALSRRALQAQEAERKRIARSLHDDTAQNLSSLIVSLDRLQAHPPLTDAELTARLRSAADLARRTVQELRKIIFGLRPSVLDDLGLVPAIRSYSQRQLADSGVRLTFNLPAETPPLSSEQAVALFRITQEAIHNVVQHAAATEVSVTLLANADRVCLFVEDDGRGFDPTAAAQVALSSEQLGLLGMAERAELIGANFVVESTPGEGSCVQVCLPRSATAVAGAASPAPLKENGS